MISKMTGVEEKYISLVLVGESRRRNLSLTKVVATIETNEPEIVAEALEKDPEVEELPTDLNLLSISKARKSENISTSGPTQPINNGKGRNALDSVQDSTSDWFQLDSIEFLIGAACIAFCMGACIFTLVRRCCVGKPVSQEQTVMQKFWTEREGYGYKRDPKKSGDFFVGAGEGDLEGWTETNTTTGSFISYVDHV
jgi:hypothetical protein